MSDMEFMEEAYKLAKKSFDQGGLPIGSVLVRDGKIIGSGHNQRVQKVIPLLMARWIVSVMPDGKRHIRIQLSTQHYPLA